MPIEVHSQSPIHTPTRASKRGEKFKLAVSKPGHGVNEPGHGVNEPGEGVNESANTQKALLVTVKHNWSHDLESFFWLLLWFILLRLMFDHDELKTERQEWGNEIFDEGSEPSWLRHTVFKIQKYLVNGLRAWLPVKYRSFVQPLEFIRENLWRSHFDRKPDERSQEYHVSDFVTVRDCLQACLYIDEEVGPIPLEQANLPTTLIATPNKSGAHSDEFQVVSPVILPPPGPGMGEAGDDERSGPALAASDEDEDEDEDEGVSTGPVFKKQRRARSLPL
jgi:hypothetical protein